MIIKLTKRPLQQPIDVRYMDDEDGNARIVAKVGDVTFTINCEDGEILGARLVEVGAQLRADAALKEALSMTHIGDYMPDDDADADPEYDGHEAFARDLLAHYRLVAWDPPEDKPAKTTT